MCCFLTATISYCSALPPPPPAPFSPTPPGLLISPEVLRPKLAMRQGVLHVRMDMGDVLAHDAMRTLAMRARSVPVLLTAPSDLDDLIPLLAAQDRSASFRRLMGPKHATPLATTPMSVSTNRSPSPQHDASAAYPATSQDSEVRGSSPIAHGAGDSALFLSPLSPTAGGGGSVTDTGDIPAWVRRLAAKSSPSWDIPGLGAGPGPSPSSPVRVEGRHIVVFITQSSLSSLAVDAALAVCKPGRDTCHLVTVVSGRLHVDAATAMLEAHYAVVARALVEVQQEVLVGGVHVVWRGAGALGAWVVAECRVF